MYRELSPLRENLRAELQTTLPDMGSQVDRERLLNAYVEQLILYVGADVANDSVTAVAISSDGQVVDSLKAFANEPTGFGRFKTWIETLRLARRFPIVAVAAECTGIYYEEFWRYLDQETDYARVLYNPHTTHHMADVLSTKVRDDLSDAYVLAQQLLLGSTPESRPDQAPELLAARECARIARSLAQEINRKKNQLKALVRTHNPALYRAFPGPTLYSQAAKALLRHYLFPEEMAALDEQSLLAFLAQHCRRAPERFQVRDLLEQARQCYPKVTSTAVVRYRVHDLLDDLDNLQQRRQRYLQLGYQQIEDRPETSLLRAIHGAGEVITLSLISEIGDISRFDSGDQLASFLGLTTSKHISGTTLHKTKGITKHGSPVARFAAVQLALSLSRTVPKYVAMYERIKTRKPRGAGHYIALVAVARDFVSNILFDMLAHHRPFFVEVEDYRAYRQAHPQQAA